MSDECDPRPRLALNHTWSGLFEPLNIRTRICSDTEDNRLKEPFQRPFSPTPRYHGAVPQRWRVILELIDDRVGQVGSDT